MYKIQYECYDKCSIRQTKWKIGVRFQEHLRNIKNHEVEISPIAEHSSTVKTKKFIKNVIIKSLI